MDILNALKNLCDKNLESYDINEIKHIKTERELCLYAGTTTHYLSKKLSDDHHTIII